MNSGCYISYQTNYMLPFFRKIRWRLAQDNQFLKYSRYAIGEIVLVVIGILIALYINNWNEERKKRNIEEILLKGLQEDLSRNKESIESNLEVLTFISGYIESLLYAQNENISYSDTLTLYFHYARVFPQSTISFLAFDKIESYGTDIVTSEDLRNKIIHLFKLTFPDMTETINRLEAPLRLLQLEHQAENFFVSDESLIPNNGERLMQDKEYFNLISQRRQYYIYFATMKKNSLNELISVQNMIEHELKKRK